MKRFLTLFLVLIFVALGLPSPGFTITYTAALDGANSSPPNLSPGKGYGVVKLNTVAHLLSVQVSFSGLLAESTIAHIHGPTAAPGTGNAGVITPTPTFPGFPAGVTSGSYHGLFDTTLVASWNSAFITASGGTPLDAEAAFASFLAAGTTYFNIHTSLYPAGEIRGFLTPAPLPGALLLFGTGLMGLAITRLRKMQV